MLPFNLCFMNESTMEHEQKKFTQYTSVHSSLPTICIQHPRCPMCTEFYWTYNAWELEQTQNQYKVSVLYYNLVKERGGRAQTVPRAVLPIFPYLSELTVNAKIRQWCSKKHECPRNPIISFFTCVSSQYQPSTNTKNEAIEGKRKRGNHGFFSCPSLSVS